MVKEKRILSYFIGWLILGLFICFVGISNTYALVIDGKFQGKSVNTNIGIDANSYIQNNSYITVDESNALNYYVAEICTTNNVFSISNVSSQSGNISYSKSMTNIKTCNTTNYNGTLAKIYFKVNQWADAGNGNFGVIFNFRLNSNVSYYTDIRVMNIYTTNEIDETSELLNNQTNELNNSINNSTNTITGSIGDAENNINQNIDDMESAIVDSNKETQNVIKDQFNSCHDSYNLFDKSNLRVGYIQTQTGEFLQGGESSATRNIINLPDNTYTVSGAKTVKICYYDDNSTFIRCDILEGSNVYSFTLSEYNNIRLQFMTSSIENIMLNVGSTAKPYEPYGEEICSNRLDDTNDKLGDLNNSLNNSNVDGSLNNAGSFFDNFSTTDHGGLSGIITAPLVAINQMLNTSCNPMTTNFKGKELSLPCGYYFWNRLGAIQDFVNIVLGGMLCYRIIIKLYKLIERIKNPEDDRLEVMDL